MILPSFLVLSLVPVLASAAIFPPDTLVKSINAKGFRQAMKENRTSLVAFVAPWCGHCQRMAPEYSKAAKTLHPFIPLYAVDCDDDKNKNLCADQGVKGFPTVKLYPRGNQKNPIEYPGERTASAFVDYVSRRIPHNVQKLPDIQDILNWIYDDNEVVRILLLTQDKRIPMMWKVLDNKFSNINFGVHRDKEGFQAIMLGVPEGSKIIVYGPGSNDPTVYKGPTKYHALVQYLESILDGTTVLKTYNREEEDVQTDKPEENTTSGVLFDQVHEAPQESSTESTIETTAPDHVLEEILPSPTPIPSVETEAETFVVEEHIYTSIDAETQHTSAEEPPATSEFPRISTSTVATTESISIHIPAEPSEHIYTSIDAETQHTSAEEPPATSEFPRISTSTVATTESISIHIPAEPSEHIYTSIDADTQHTSAEEPPATSEFPRISTSTVATTESISIHIPAEPSKHIYTSIDAETQHTSAEEPPATSEFPRISTSTVATTESISILIPAEPSPTGTREQLETGALNEEKLATPMEIRWPSDTSELCGEYEGEEACQHVEIPPSSTVFRAESRPSDEL